MFNQRIRTMLTLTPKLTLTSEFLRGACMMELNELLHTTYLEEWGVTVKPHPRMKDWKVVQIWVVLRHVENSWDIDVDSDNLTQLRNDLWIQGEVINQWINE